MMSGSVAFDRCREFIDAQTLPTRVAVPSDAPRRAITISRQAGAGSHAVARELIKTLQARTPEGSRPWAMFDRDLVEKVLEDHELPGRLAEYMPEDRVSEISDAMDELFGLHPATRVLVRKTAETILRLAELGNVVLIGRASNIITMGLGHVFHVRLVGSLEERVRHVMDYEGLPEKEAAGYVRSHDLGRKRYVEKYYRGDVDDVLLYDLVLNTDRIAYDEAARIITDAALDHDPARRTGAAAAR
jgi:hypothetical protein